MRRCKCIYYKGREKVEVEGKFHQWGICYEEFEAGPGNYTVAIVELDDGTVVMAEVQGLQFLTAEASVKLVKRKATLGEWIQITDSTLANNCTCGGIYQVVEDNGFIYVGIIAHEAKQLVAVDEYVVMEGYHESKI